MNDYNREYDQVISFDKKICELQSKKNTDAKITMSIFGIIGFIWSIIPWDDFKVATNYVALVYVFIGLRNYSMYLLAIKEDNKYVSIFSKIKYCPVNIELYKKMKINKLFKAGGIVFLCISVIQVLCSLIFGKFSYMYFIRTAVVAAAIIVSIFINILDHIKPLREI